MKKIARLFLITFLSITLFNYYSFAFELDGIIYYETNDSNNTVVIFDAQSKCNTMFESGIVDLVIPSTVSYNGKIYSITKIGKEAFKGCDRIKSITLPQSISEIGQEAFRNCTWLTSINLPEGMTVIESSIFYECTNLKQIKIPAGVTKIKNHAFSKCINLETVFFPSSINSIGDFAFAQCAKINAAAIPYGVKEIPLGCFDRCTSLTTVELPESITKIESLAFTECNNLKTIICSAKLPPHAYSMGGGLFPSIDNPYIHVYVPCESVEYYKNDEEWRKLRNLKCDAQKEAEIKQKKLAEQLKRKSIEERKILAKRELIKYTKQYNDSLRNNPWYCKDYTLSFSQIPDDALSTSDKCKSWIKQEKNRIYKKYVEFSRGDVMKNTLRTKYPDEYIVKAAKVNPDLNIQLREIDIEYRCMDESKINQIKIELIDNGKMPALESSCRAKQYNDNKRLFPSKEEFDTAYNNATSDSEFIDFIQKKKKQYKILQYLSSTLYGNKNLNLCEAESASTSSKKGQIIHSVIDDMSSLSDKYFYDQGIEYIMQYCPKFKKDYEKNKIYFDSVDMFYHSYISANYKTILKQRINNYKNGIKQ